MNIYKLGSLFDGSGGFPLAGALCGIEPVWASEVKPYPIAVTRSRFPNMKHLGNISKVNGAQIEPVDIVTFGSPCQDISVAGKRAGVKHEANGDEETTRSGMLIEAVRIIEEMRIATNGKYPRFAVWENVPGAFSSNGGEDFRIVCEALIKIVEPAASMPPVPKGGWSYADCYFGNGWSLAYRVFDAQYWGVPQRRRRIHLVLDLTGGRAREVLFEREGVRGYFAEGRTPWQTTPADAQRSTGADDRDGERTARGDGRLDAITGMVFSVENHPADSRVNIDDSGKVQTLTGRMGTGGGNVPLVMVPFCKSARPRSADDATTWKYGKIANTLNTFDRGEVRANELVVESRPPRYFVRRLTTTECARLQGFADRWGDIDPKADFTEEEFRFWKEVRNTFTAINGGAIKEYTVKQMLTWYNRLQTDSNEYEMWGNGIAIPPALYCMQGVIDALNAEEDEEWML